MQLCRSALYARKPAKILGTKWGRHDVSRIRGSPAGYNPLEKVFIIKLGRTHKYLIMREFIRILQIILNCNWRAYDLLKQVMLEKNIGVALISEPPRNLKESSVCLLSKDLAAVLWRPESADGWNCRVVYRGKGSITVLLDDVYIISCYVSPHVRNDSYLKFLDNLDRACNFGSNKTMVCGDFNAHSALWGSANADKKGEFVERWAAARDLRLLNDGLANTCVRPQGCSIIDLTWASPCVLERAGNWSVLENIETLSDHQYVANICLYIKRLDISIG